MAAVSRQSIGSVLRARIQLAVRVPRGWLAASPVTVMAASNANGSGRQEQAEGDQRPAYDGWRFPAAHTTHPTKAAVATVPAA